MTPEQITGPIADHGEGPVWEAGAGVLRWVDLTAGDLLALDPATSAVDRRHVGPVAAAVRPRAGGGLVLALERRFALLDPGAATPRPLPQLWTDPGVRFNDGGCDPQGRFWCGSMGYGAEPGAGALYRLDPDGSVTTQLVDVTISNGIAWSPDGATTYYVDTPTQRVDAFDFDGASGTLSGRRPVVVVPADRGGPDGMCVDAEGGLWVALYDGGAVHRYRPDGSLDEVVELPTPRVTACTLGGPRLDELYITTSRVGVPAGEEPTAGALFRALPGVTGLPTAAFAG